MSFIEWLPEYETGFEEIDAQHRSLIKILNDLHSMLYEEKTGREELKKVINFLNEYIVEHFSTEENLMKNAPAFPPDFFEKHLKEHRYFIDRIQEFTGLFENGSLSTKELVKLFEFLGNWFCGHILRIDKDTATLLKK